MLGSTVAATSLEDLGTVGLHPQGAWSPALDPTGHEGHSLDLKSLLKLGVLSGNKGP